MRFISKILISAGIAVAAFSVSAQKIKTLEFLQDDAQERFVSKVYSLEHIDAVDATPFVLGAVTRYNVNSTVDRINYVHGKKQFLLVNTPPAMMAYVDELVKQLDQPGNKKDVAGSIVDGTGVTRFAYLPKHRSSAEVVAVLNAAVKTGSGAVYRDPASNLIYWKDTAAIGETILNWAKAFDRPVPQVELEFKVYEVRDSTLDDIGIDYLAWKNGPGLNIFQTGLESVGVQSVESALSNADMFSSFSYGGFFAAPQFDLSFVRMLSQKGRAKITASGTLSVINSYDKTYYVKFSPQLENIEKDASDKTSIVAGAGAGFTVNVIKPVINFKADGEKDGIFKGDAFDITTYAKTCGTIQFGYELTMDNVVERNNRGTELTDSSTISSNLTFEFCHEQLLGTYNQNQKVEQTIGVPFLSDIPVLKYLFSTTTSINESTKLFVTVKGRLVHPEDNYAKWSGKLLTEADFKLNDIAKIDKEKNK